MFNPGLYNLSIEEKINYVRSGTLDVFTVHNEQLDEMGITAFDLFNAFQDYKIIILNRVNKLDQFVSHELANFQNKYMFKKYEDIIGFNAQKYYQQTRDNINFYNNALLDLERSSAFGISVNYDERKFLEEDKIEEFLGRKLYPANTVVIQREKPIEEYFSNPEAVKSMKLIKYKI